MDEPRKLAKYKKPDTKDHILCDFSLCEMSRIGKSVEMKSRSVLAWAWETEGMGVIAER